MIIVLINITSKENNTNAMFIMSFMLFLHRVSFDRSLPWLIPNLLKAQPERLWQVLRHVDVFGIWKG